MQSKLLLAGAIAATLLAVGCGSGTSTSQASPSPIASPSVAAAGTTIAVATDAKLGQILVDGKGMTLYLFVKDTGPISTCYDACAQIWPPVLTTDTPKAGTCIAAELLGTTTRNDGKLEVTYNHHPLYYIIQDKKPGDATGQGVDGLGGLWWVLSPSGAPITTK